MPTEGLSEETLKPCPFCRSTLLTVEPTRPGDAWNVYCTDCEASGPILPAHDEVIAAWNNRAEGPAPPGGGVLSPKQAWQDLLDKDDRTSPAEYPEMALITFEELADYMAAAALTKGADHG